MLNYKQFYIKIGNRKIADIIDPKVMVADDLEYPLDTYIYWLNISDVLVGPSYDYGYLKNIKYPIVLTPYEYGKDTIGNFTIKGGVNPSKVIADFKKGSKGFKFLKPNTSNINLNSKKVLLFNYGAINSFYRYTQHPFNTYYKWYNGFSTCVEAMDPKISGDGKNKFLLINIPRALPERLLMEKYAANLTRQGLDLFINNSYLNILELWRYLTPEYKETSILAKIPVEELDNITLIFSLNNKVSLLNLGLLTSLVDEYGLKSKLAKYKAKTVRKLIYLFLNKVISKSGLPIDQIVNKVETDTDNQVDISDVEDDLNESKVDEVTNNVDDDVSDVVDESTIIDMSDTNEIAEIYEDIESNDDTPMQEVITTKIEVLEKKRLISKNRATKLKEVIAKQDNITLDIPGGGKVKLKELATYVKEDFELSKDDLTIPDNGYIDDKDQLEDTIKAFDKKYITKVMQKDVINTLMSVQNNDMLVEDISISSKQDITGELITYNISVIGLDGKKSKISMILPKIEEDGSFLLSNNRYTMRKQKSDKIIRKIDYNRVALTTYYGKLFITKATYKKDDIGFWFKKQILNKYGDDNKLSNLVVIPSVSFDYELPLEYTQISRYVKSFIYNGYYYYFNYEERARAFGFAKDKAAMQKIEGKDKYLVASNKNNYILIDNNNQYWLYNKGKYTKHISIYETLDIDRSKAPMEYSNIKIYKETLPVVLLLSYYVGITKLIKRTKLKYRRYASNERVKLANNEYSIKFRDIQLVVEKDYGVNDMLFGGYRALAKTIKNVDYKSLDNKTTFTVLYTELGLPVVYDTEIKMLHKMYIDPISKSILEDMGEPTNFTDLLLRTNELLIDDNYVNPNDMSNMVIKGYERISGMMYSELVKSIKAHENRSSFSSSKLNVSPYSILAKISEDSTTVLVDDLNPIAELKQHEDVSMIGFGGRSKEGMNRDTRIMHSSEIGVISEASKDSSDVGITAMMVANPNITNLRGSLETYNNKSQNKSKTMSTTSLLYPASNKDDVKRLTYLIQRSCYTVMYNRFLSNCGKPLRAI